MSSTKSRLISKCCNELIDIHRHAIDAVKPENLMRNSIHADNRALVVKTESEPLRYELKNTSVHVIGGGKSVMAMALGLRDIARRAKILGSFSHGCLSLPVGLESSSSEKALGSIGIKCHYGSKNNLPDLASADASENILNTITEACESDLAHKRDPLFVVLISGGGSACLTSPRYLTLSEKLEIIKYLVQKGANIVELNKVRRYFSNIKGGGLARHILAKNPSSKILSLILSDVIDDPIEFIASGPTFLNSSRDKETQRDQMMEILTRYQYPSMEKITANSTNDETYSMTNNAANIVNHIIGNNRLAIGAAIQRAHSLGYEVKNLGSDLQGNTSSIVDRLVQSARETFVKSSGDRILVIGGGEATVIKADHETWGLGGRAQEMALDYVISGLSTGWPKQDDGIVDLLLAGTTDGQDGPTDVGACLASCAEFMDDSRVQLGAVQSAKVAHDSNNFWSSLKPHWLIRTGLTGTNVMDLYMHSLVKET